MQKTEMRVFQFLVQCRIIFFEFIAKMLHYIGSSTDGSGTIISMLCYFLPRAGHNETRQRGNIERIFTIATGAYNVDHIMTIQISAFSQLQQSIPETLEFINGDTAHQVNCHE